MSGTSGSNSDGISNSVSSPSGEDSSSSRSGGTKRRSVVSSPNITNAGDSASNKTAILSTNLTSVFECTVCMDCILPPILQCSGGHLICGACRLVLKTCPTCHISLGNIRNLALEKLGSSFLFPCKYSLLGCSLMLLHSDKANHEESCEHCPYYCPCPSSLCKWQGRLEQVMVHLRSAHKTLTSLEGEDVIFLATDVDHPGAVDWAMIQSCFGFNFLLVLQKQEKHEGHQQFCAFVQMIGSRKQCEGFAYRLELNGSTRRLTWEAIPKSINENISAAMLNSDCLVMDTSTAKLFMNNNNLGINVTITTNV